MSHKAAPLANRIPLHKEWRSRWFGGRMTAANTIEDAYLRSLIQGHYRHGGLIERLEIRRTSQELAVMIHTAKPGVIIGRGGKGIQELRSLLTRKLQSFRHRLSRFHLRSDAERTQLEKLQLKLEIVEVKTPELHAALVAQNIASQIERRIAYRRAVRQAIERTMQRGAHGIRVTVAGRLAGADIARREKFSEGTVPLATFRNDIDYAHTDAKTSSYGTIGVKVWIYRSDKLAEALKPQGRRVIE